MNRGADWRILSDIEPAAIDCGWFDLAHRSYVNAMSGIRCGLADVQPYPWHKDAESLAHVFGLGAETHCFSVASHEWIDPLEPQITRGFVHFLSQGSPTQQRARCLAFVKAAHACSPRSLSIEDLWRPVSVCAAAEENRIDILVELSDGVSRFGAVIEAKFGHQLTKGQLEGAEKYTITELGWDMARSALLVIAPLLNGINMKLMRSRPLWLPVTWWAFMARLEQETEELHDCADYRRFRRTVWRKGY